MLTSITNTKFLKMSFKQSKPHYCSERLIKVMADTLVSDGYRSVGYEYVIIDDCWLASERDQDGRLLPDPKRFPSGIKHLADYVSINEIKHKFVYMSF